MEVRARIPASTATTTRFIIGFTGETFGLNPTTMPTNGAFFAASSTNNFWIAVVRNANVETRVQTTVSTTTIVSPATTGGTFQRFRIEVSSSTAIFLINGNVVATISQTTQPIGNGNNLAPMVQAANGGTGNGNLQTAANAINSIDIAYIKTWVDDPPDNSPAPAGMPAPPPLDLTQGADIAEADLADDPLSYLPGMLVSNATSTMIGSTTPMVRKSFGRYDGDILGAVSASPNIILGQESPNTVRIGLVGRVPVIVSRENGAIHQGDRITSSSIEGVGMRAARPGQIAGIALGDFGIATSSCDALLPQELANVGVVVPADACLGTVLVSLKPGTDLSIGSMLQDVTGGIADWASAAVELADSAFANGAQFAKVIVGELVAKVAVIGDLFAKNVHTEELCVGNVCVTQDQFLKMVQSSGATAAAPPAPPAPPDTAAVPVATSSVDAAPSTPPADAPPLTDTPSSSSTPPDTTTQPPADTTPPTDTTSTTTDVPPTDTTPPAPPENATPSADAPPPTP
jgi:hypothetical protein